MEIERTFRISPIREVYRDPSIIEKVRFDNYSHDSLLNPDFKKNIFLLGWDDNNELIGFMQLEVFTNVTFRMHGAVLKNKRKYALESTMKCIEWAFNNTECRNIISEIPSKHVRTNEFVDKLGFIDCGVIKNNVMIDGILYDTIIKQLERKI